VRTLTGMYKAVCLDVDTEAQVLRCQVPQIFNDETVTCLDLVGGVTPKPGAMGWVGFEAGYPDHPVWMGTDTFGTGETPVGGIYVTRDYRWVNQVTPTDPGNGRIKVNNLDPNLATEVYMSAYDADNTAYLSAKSLRIGDLLAVYLSGDATTRIEYRVSAALVNNTTWFRIPVIVSVNHGFSTATPGNNAQVKVVVQTADIGPQAPDEVWVGPSTPPSALSELWFDTDQPGGGSVGVLRANVGGLWTDITPAGPIPAGGATGSLLAKKSGTDYDSQWITQASMGFVLKTGDTMTGQLTLRSGGGLQLALVGDGAHIGFYDNTGNTRRGYLQGHADGVTLSADIGNLSLTCANRYTSFNNSIRVGEMSAFGAAYGGIGWTNGQYLIMSDGTNSFVTAPGSGGNVSIRGGANNGYQFNINSNGNHQIIGNVNHAGYAIDGISTVNASGDIVSGAWMYANGGYIVLGGYGGGGWFYNGDGWNRAAWDRSIYTAGALSVAHIDCNNIDTRSGYRIVSNGGWSGHWGEHAFLAQNASGGYNRTGYSMHPGGVAKSIDMMQGNGYINFLNEGGDNYAELFCLSITQTSKGSSKQDVVSWPPKSAGSAVMGAASRLSLIDVVSYRIKADYALTLAESLLEGQGPRRNHDCAIDDCYGTDMETDPCQRVKDWQNPMLGVLIEDIATVLPEAVGLDPEGNPGGMRIGSMVGYLLAVCKEQQERIEALEQNHQEAA
jgi:hypothetical protein